MRPKNLAAAVLLALVVSSGVFGQERAESTTEKSSKPTASRIAYFIDPTLLDLARILPPPPEQNSATTKNELADLHQIENARTQQQVLAAQADDKEQDIFIFRDVLGGNFNPDNFPITAALSAHMHNDEGVMSKALKTSFARPRPFQFDATLHPVCQITKEANSYPSGHTLSGYLLAFALVQMLPEKQNQIMERADSYARNRMICGVHYSSDIEAGRSIAYAMFGYMLANPRFQKELAAAKNEMRSRMGLPIAEQHM